MFPKPEVYHTRSCPLAKEKLHLSQQNEQSKLSAILPQIPRNIKNILKKPLNKSESVCSCGQGASENLERLEKLDSEMTNIEEDGKKLEEVVGKESEEGKDFVTELVDTRLDEGISKTSDNDGNETLEDSGAVEDKSVGQIEETVDKSSESEEGVPKVKPGTKLAKGQKKLSVSFTLPETDDVAVVSKKPESEGIHEIESGENVDTGKVGTSETALDAKIDDSGKAEKQDANGETRIGSIVYLPVEEDSNGEVTLKSVEKTQSTLSKLSAEEFAEISKSDSNLAEPSAGKTENREVEKTRSSSTSSLGPFSPTPHLSAFVNYATGFFQRNPSDSSIKDIKDVIMGSFDSLTDSRQIDDSKMDAKTLNQNQVGQSERKSDLPVISAAPSGGKKRGKLSRHGDVTHANVAVESAVGMDEKAELFNVDYSRKFDLDTIWCFLLGGLCHNVFIVRSFFEFGIINLAEFSEYEIVCAWDVVVQIPDRGCPF